MIEVNIIGLKEVQDNIQKYSEQIRKEVSAAVENGAKIFVRNAKRAAPVDLGVLRNEITYLKLSDLRFEVISQAKYSPYVEWGTITRVSVPGELQAYAMQFKGRGIKKNGGIYPHPFFFPQIPFVKKQVETMVAAIVKSQKKA